jgi:hypothetical protein
VGRAGLLADKRTGDPLRRIPAPGENLGRPAHEFIAQHWPPAEQHGGPFVLVVQAKPTINRCHGSDTGTRGRPDPGLPALPVLLVPLGPPAMDGGPLPSSPAGLRPASQFRAPTKTGSVLGPTPTMTAPDLHASAPQGRPMFPRQPGKHVLGQIRQASGGTRHAQVQRAGCCVACRTPDDRVG